MFQYSQTVYTLKTLLSQNWFYFFFLIFWHSKIPSSSGTPRYKHYFFIYTMALRCPFPFSIFFTSLQNFFTSLHHLFYFPSPFVKFPFRVSFLLCQLFSFSSELSFTSLHHFLYLPSPFFYFPSEFFYFTSAFLSSFYFPSAFFTSLPSLFTSLQIIHNSFYLPSVFFTTLTFNVLFLFLHSFSIFLLPFSFFKLFLLSFGIFIVSFLIFKYRRKLNTIIPSLIKRFWREYQRRPSSHRWNRIKAIIKDKWLDVPNVFSDTLYAGWTRQNFRSVVIRLLDQRVYLPRDTRIFTCLQPAND